jgi:leucine-zipper of insertion element IS481
VKLHGNARFTPVQRRLMCARVEDEGWTVAEAADTAGISDRLCGCRKLVQRVDLGFRAGVIGMVRAGQGSARSGLLPYRGGSRSTCWSCAAAEIVLRMSRFSYCAH